MVFKLIFVIAYWCSSVNLIAAIKCYNCGTDNTDTCENFNTRNSSFVVECPKKFSCGLETHVDKIIRTCEELFLDDCQKANNIKYCYCTGDLCNGYTIQFSNSDDEDLVEGSGVTTTLISTTTLTPTTTITPFVTVPKIGNGQQKIGDVNILVLSFLCLDYFNILI